MDKIGESDLNSTQPRKGEKKKKKKKDYSRNKLQ